MGNAVIDLPEDLQRYLEKLLPRTSGSLQQSKESARQFTQFLAQQIRSDPDADIVEFLYLCQQYCSFSDVSDPSWVIRRWSILRSIVVGVECISENWSGNLEWFKSLLVRENFDDDRGTLRTLMGLGAGVDPHRTVKSTEEFSRKVDVLRKYQSFPATRTEVLDLAPEYHIYLMGRNQLAHELRAPKPRGNPQTETARVIFDSTLLVLVDVWEGHRRHKP